MSRRAPAGTAPHSDSYLSRRTPASDTSRSGTVGQDRGRAHAVATGARGTTRGARTGPRRRTHRRPADQQQPSDQHMDHLAFAVPDGEDPRRLGGPSHGGRRRPSRNRPGKWSPFAPTARSRWQRDRVGGPEITASPRAVSGGKCSGPRCCGALRPYGPCRASSVDTEGEPVESISARHSAHTGHG